MRLEGFGHLPADGERGVERGHGFLKDHGDFLPPHLSHLFIVQRQEVMSVKPDLATHDATRRIRHQPHDAEGAYRLAAAAFSHYSDRLSLADVVRHPVHGLHDPFEGEEVCPQVFHLKQRTHRSPRPEVAILPRLPDLIKATL